MEEMYIILPEWFVLKYRGHKDGENVFNAVLTNNGEWAAALNSISDFYDTFFAEDIDLPIKKLTPNDFPLPANPMNK